MTDSRDHPFVSRAGLKLDHALRDFNIDVTGFVCADFGCNIGGFTDCLLQRGAAKVCAIDTGYGMLAWKLRNDPRVVVMERTNALHAMPPLSPGEGRGEGCPRKVETVPTSGRGKQVAVPNYGGMDLVVIDIAWTPQRLAIPAALRWLKTDGRIITLVKPHYELDDDEKNRLLVDGRLDPIEAERVLNRVMKDLPQWGAQPIAHTLSPITGGKSSRGKAGAGNIEYLVLATPNR